MSQQHDSNADDPGFPADPAALQEHLAALSRERDRAYQALAMREADLARVQRIAGVGGVEVDLRDGFKNRRSPEYLAIHGLPPDAAHETHEAWVDRIHPEDRKRTEQYFLDAIKGSDSEYVTQYRIIRPDNGQVRWVDVRARIERDAEGRATRLIGAHFDITDRKLAEAELRESEERFRQITNSAPVPMWVTKLDRTRGFVNQAYMDFLGLPFEEACAFDWRDIIHPDDLTRILKEQIAGESSLKPFVLEARYRRVDGEWRWLRSESQPRFDPHGAHAGFVGIANDVTLAKQAEADLRAMNETLEHRIRERTTQLAASEAQMRTMFETSNMYQALLDTKGNLIDINRTALASIRSDIASVRGKPFWNTPWFAGTDGMRDVIRDAFARVLQGEAVRTELRLNLPVGERIIDFAMRPIIDEYGSVTGAVPEAVDITERKEGEDALRQSQKMEAVGQLTGGVAHDFNNLLTIIRSATDFLRRRDLPEERRRRYIDAISDTVDRASKLTGQLLAFARRQPLKPQVFNVGSQIDNIAQLIRPVVGTAISITIEVAEAHVDRPDDGFFALADIAQFETAIINLAVNARDAMADGGDLKIKVERVSGVPPLRGQPRRGGEFIAVSVEDTGTGIPFDKLEAIFEPFFTTKEVGKGTGLGLSQAFGFAKQSGGDIAVRSVPGAGATFTIYLPQAEMPTDSAAIEAAGTDTAQSGRGHRVLVVEDNEDIGRFSTDLLQDLGYKISWVTNATDALAALGKDEFAFDLVFSDIIMPGMNGVELATTIRERFPGLPVVLTSGYSNVLAENAHSGFELIQKPYSVEALSRTLRRAIADRRQVAG